MVNLLEGFIDGLIIAGKKSEQEIETETQTPSLDESKNDRNSRKKID